jgi:hypothetical protein
MSNTITPTVFHRKLNVEGLEIFYREAGPGMFVPVSALARLCIVFSYISQSDGPWTMSAYKEPDRAQRRFLCVEERPGSGNHSHWYCARRTDVDGGEGGGLQFAVL